MLNCLLCLRIHAIKSGRPLNRGRDFEFENVVYKLKK